jgi:hypothetical protein
MFNDGFSPLREKLNIIEQIVLNNYSINQFYIVEL